MEHWVRTVLNGLVADCARPISQESKKDLRRIAEVIERSDYHVFRRPSLEEFADAITQVEDIDQLAKIMWRVTVECGFQHFIIFVLAQGTSVFRTRVCSSVPERWTRRYEEMSYQHIDPVLSAAIDQDQPIIFANLNSSAPAVESFWQDAEQNGVGRDGVCFAATWGDGSRLGVSFCTGKPPDLARKSILENAYDLQFIAFLASESFKALAQTTQSSLCPLTVKELRFLHVLATTQNPEDAFEIDTGFGSNKALQASIRDKLGVTTVFQAIAHSASRGWFDDLPFSATEVQRPFPGLSSLAAEDAIWSENERGAEEKRFVTMDIDLEAAGETDRA